MAAKTPSSVKIENFGTSTMYIASFADIDSGDTWASNVTEAIMYWANPTDNPTRLFENIDVSYSNSATTSGVFNFYPAENSRTCDLYVLTRG